jgi:hypothetical protein
MTIATNNQEGGHFMTDTTVVRRPRHVWTLPEVRDAHAKEWKQLQKLAVEVRDSSGIGMEATEHPHWHAIELTIALRRTPYVSLAIEAHRWAVKALQSDLRTHGCCDEHVAKLVNALWDLLNGAGLRIGSRGALVIDSPEFQRALREYADAPPMLLWDADGLVESNPSEAKTDAQFATAFVRRWGAEVAA